MDVLFNCPKCDQELAVDSSGAGTEIPCPNCGEMIVIPEAEMPIPRPQAVPASVNRHSESHANPIASSAAAKIEMHLKVPVHASTESLIEKPKPPLEAAAKETEKRIRVKTIRHTDCIEVGHDRFDEIVSNFLGKVGESNVINISTLNYTILDIGTQKLMTDFGLLIIYRG